MIKVIIEKENGFYKNISIVGHAMYADYGKDIVCAAASSIVTTTVNGILSLDKNSISYDKTATGLNIIVNSNNKTIQILLNNMIQLLKELESNYPANIKVK